MSDAEKSSIPEGLSGWSWIRIPVNTIAQKNFQRAPPRKVRSRSEQPARKLSWPKINQPNYMVDIQLPLPLEMFQITGVSEVRTVYHSRGIRPEQRPKVTSSRDLYKLFIQLYKHGMIECREEFYCLYLNRRLRVTGWKLVNIGSLDSTTVNVRDIIKGGLDTNAAALAICHNHPSGELTPSNNDRKITTQTKEAARLFDMDLIDHLIVSPFSYTSFADEGIL